MLGPQNKKFKIVGNTGDLIKDGKTELVVKEHQEIDLEVALGMIENSFAIFANHLNSKERAMESEGSSCFNSLSVHDGYNCRKGS
mmetsp:Transcript_32104/g.32376  ORF Transcript_32104/g.32376 Transcript_32104/m.32376 type:complete len:85 (-) Transcript_32104:399-653(-)